VAEWKQVPEAMFQHLVESLPRRVEAVTAAVLNCDFNKQVSTYFWSCCLAFHEKQQREEGVCVWVCVLLIIWGDMNPDEIISEMNTLLYNHRQVLMSYTSVKIYP
jgi:hypothetical protein